MPEPRIETFQTPGPIALRVHTGGGQVDVYAEPVTTTTVELRARDGDDDERVQALLEKTRVELHGDELTVEVPHRAFDFLRRQELAITIRMPENSTVRAHLSSADLTVQGTVSTAELHTASGDLRLGDVTGDVKAHSASGDLSIGHAGGAVQVRSASGDLDVQSAEGDVAAHSASGDIEIGAASGSVRVRTASGDVSVGVARQGVIEISSASGDVTVGVAAGVGVWLDISSMSGDTASDLAIGSQEPTDGCQLRLSARTMSGDVRITRAAA